MEYNFYFDESFHTRKITRASLEDTEYFNSYISVGIGIKKYMTHKILKKYEIIEAKYKMVYSKDERDQIVDELKTSDNVGREPDT